MIKVALIAPGSIIKPFCTGRPYQMMLAGCLQDPQQGPYQMFYRHGNERQELRLLDNGAWEDRTLEAAELIELAEDYQASEVIAPDVIDDASETLVLTTQFFEKYQQYIKISTEAHAPHHHFHIAAVAHGETMSTAMAFVRAIAALNDQSYPFGIRTIAIGRAYSRTIGNPMARYHLARWISEHYGGSFQVHLLGFNDDWKVGELHSCADIVRSMDTAAPFTGALQNATLQGPSPLRPSDYFYTTDDRYDLELVKHNVDQVDRWAAGK